MKSVQQVTSNGVSHLNKEEWISLLFLGITTKVPVIHHLMNPHREEIEVQC
jgi:hypothetical protein